MHERSRSSEKWAEITTGENNPSLSSSIAACPSHSDFEHQFYTLSFCMWLSFNWALVLSIHSLCLCLLVCIGIFCHLTQASAVHKKLSVKTETCLLEVVGLSCRVFQEGVQLYGRITSLSDGPVRQLLSCFTVCPCCFGVIVVITEL